ncbi:TrkA C-terminal domain-containing protein [Campylobacter sp. MG1]|uniref:TrkA C-terminal domain-containing protein n=1 Tax=Campylobacter sp. MG1 TaxID=2976332 RepID=UPI00226CEA8F|nr:TrkA C-terminal domain-containing protein [Campylobacter sp. MG1]
MKKILVLAQINVAKDFLKRLATIKDNTKEYIIICQDDLDFKNNFTHIKVDPTNAARVKNYIDGKIELGFILFNNDEDTRLAYDAFRNLAKRTNVIVLSNSKEYENDSFCTLINTKQIIINNLIDNLPNMPMIARDIGLGKGEIMQVRVPVGSIYANKHINAIAQEYYKIALIYRNSKIILPKPDTQILPNDELILVGDPNILNLIFSRIKGQVGQFPSPYGDSICVIIDMSIDDNIDNLINTALLLHSKSNSIKLIFYVINPTINHHLQKLKKLKKITINVHIKYENIDTSHIIDEFYSNNSGIFIVSKHIFKKYSKKLYNSSMPILKVGKIDFAKINTITCISSGSLGVENLTSILLDISIILNIEAKLMYFDNSNAISDDLIEHIDTQSKFFGKNLELVEFKSTNPLFTIKNDLTIMHCLGFEKHLLDKNTFKYFSNDFSKLYEILDDNFQLFIPIE